jgi:hypothetical protein
MAKCCQTPASQFVDRLPDLLLRLLFWYHYDDPGDDHHMLRGGDSAVLWPRLNTKKEGRRW